MNISCNCHAFNATLTGFPRNTTGRLICYCRDCQTFAAGIGRRDVLDDHGGTEVIAAYPAETEILRGIEHLACYRVTESGPFRWVASCCNSPIVNVKPGLPWAGYFHTAFTEANAQALDSLGEVKCRVFGRDALPGAPFEITETIGFRDMWVVLPFLVKGRLFGKHRHSPFFRADDKTPIVEPQML